MRFPFFGSKENSTDSAAARPAADKRRAAPRGAARAADTVPGVGDEATVVEQARTQARRRLIGALVLLAAGVVGFPLLFETQPRPLAPGLSPAAISGPADAARGEAPRADASPGAVGRVASGPVTAVGSGAVGGAVASAVSGAASAASAAGSANGAVTGALVGGAAVAAAAVATAVATAPPASAAKAATAKPEPAKVEAKKVDAPKAEPKKVEPAKPEAPKPESKKAEVPKPAAAAATAATPSAAPPAAAAASAPAAPRYVVQVGAFNDATRMRDARNKVEKLGFKTYTSEVDSPTGRRTRVRLGPFATKKEADSAAAKVKTVGLPANVLTL